MIDRRFMLCLYLVNTSDQRDAGNKTNDDKEKALVEIIAKENVHDGWTQHTKQQPLYTLQKKVWNINCPAVFCTVWL